MSGKDRYDTMIPFFGKPNDNRVRLYLHALESEYIEKKTIQLSANWNGKDGIRPELQNVFFTTRNPGSVNDKEVHNEWNTFANNLECRLANLTHGPSSSSGAFGSGFGFASGSGASGSSRLPVDTKAILQVIISKAGAPTNPQLNFFQQVIIAYLSNVTNASGENIIAAPSRWVEATQFTFKSQDELKRIYDNAGVDSGSGCADDTALRFNYNLSKYLIAAFLESTPLITSLGNDSFWSTNYSTNNTYFRVTNDPKKLFTIDPATGNMVDITRGSDAFNTKLKDDLCLGTKAKQTGTNKCVDYIEKCINNGKPEDIAACKSFMLNAEFWDATQAEIEDMLPSIAVRTLEKFGFQFDRKNKDFKSFETVGSWLKGLEARIIIGQISGPEFENISKNFKLTQYLTKLVNKVNSSPAILNENYFNTKNFNSNDIRFANWTPYGLTPRIMMNSNFSTEIARKSDYMINNFARLRTNVQRRLHILPNGVLSVYGNPYIRVGAVPYVMMGGRATIEDEIFIKQGEDLEDLVKGTLSKLRSIGKTVDSNTEMEFKNYIEKYKDAENKLVKAITYANKYVDLIELFNEVDHQNVLNIDHLKAFVEARNNYFDKTESRQNSIFSAIQRIADDVLEEVEHKSSVSNFFKGPIISSNN